MDFDKSAGTHQIILKLDKPEFINHNQEYVIKAEIEVKGDNTCWELENVEVPVSIRIN